MFKKLLSIAILAIILTFSANAAKIKLEIPIIKNGPTVTDTLDNGQIVTYDVSSDDAEQENDEMDKLYDDDLDTGWEGAPEDQNVMNIGLRFQKISIPKGAIIDSAFIRFYAHESKAIDDIAKITIVGENSDNAETWNLETLITDRPRTTAQIKWTVAEDWTMWNIYYTPDLKDIVQEIVNRNGWVSGNSLALMLLGEDQGPTDYENTREFESFENISDPEEGGDGQNHPERVPTLFVYYTDPSIGEYIEIPIIKNGPTVTDTLDNGQIVTYDVSSDDAEQENDEMDKLYDDDLDTGWEGAPEDQNVMNIGLRFQNITIPQGSKIDSAFVRFYAHESKTIDDLAKITIAGENSDNAETWNLETLITDRPRTTAQVNWNVAEDWTMWNIYYTPDLKDIVQEIVNRNGWVSGNSLALMLLGEDQGPTDYENTREFESFENISDPEEGGDGQNHPERVPTLFVYYSSASSVESTEASAYSVFPNPSLDGAVQVVGNDLMNTKITVYDQLGNSVMEVTPNSNFAVSVNISKFDLGVYYFYINKNGNISVQKVIKL